MLASTVSANTRGQARALNIELVAREFNSTDPPVLVTVNGAASQPKVNLIVGP